MALAQDQAQASEAAAIIAEKKYQKELAQYNKDKAEYDKKKAEYDAQQKKIDDAKAAEEARIAEEERLAKEKADKRAAEFAVVEKTYQETLSKNPYTDESKKKKWSEISRNTSRVKFNYQWSQQHQRYNQNALHTKQEAEKNLRYQHYTTDGFQFADMGTGQRDFGQAVGDYKMGRPLGYRNISARGQHQFNLWLAKEQLLYGEITPAQYSQKTGKSQTSYTSYQDQAEKQRMKQAQAKAHGQLAADRSHWANVASGNYDAQNPGHNFVEVKTTPTEHGYATANILKAVEVNKSGTPLTTAAEISNYITINKQTYKVPEAPATPTIPVRTNTSSNKGVNEANILQKQYVQDLRDGKIGLAQALLQPQTPQRYSPGNTVNLKPFLKERGYDVTKPETIPDSVLMDRVKYDAARKQASDPSKPMGDLRKLVPNQPQVSDTVIQQRKETMEKYAVDKGGSFIGYGDDGTPIQGAPFVKQQFQVTTADGKVRTFNSLEHAEKFSQRMTTTQYEVNTPTTIPTMYGAIIVQETKRFDTKEQAQAFIDKRQANLPYTQDSKILPMEAGYRSYDQFAKEAYKRAEDHPDSWIYQGGAAWTSFGGDMLNLVTMGGNLLDKYVIKRPVVEKQPITTIDTYYDKGFEKAVEGIEVTDTGVTGLSPSLINPLDEGNVVSKWYQGAARQWEKQTPAENFGQSTVAIPLAIVDAVSAGQVGTSLVRRVTPIVKTVAAKAAATPTIVTKVIEASSISVKTIPVKQSYSRYNLNTIANPDRIDLNLKGADYYDKGYDLKSPKPKPLNLQSKAFQEDLANQSPKGVGNYGAERFRQFQENVSPSINVIGRIKFSEGFVPGKPTRPYTPYKPKPVEADPYYSPEKIDLNLKGDDYMVSTKPTLNLQSKAFLRDIKKQNRQPNYERAASDFVEFQKSLNPKPQRYSNIVGSIKLSEGFVPGKPTRQYKPFKPKEVEADSGYKADGKVGDILSDTVSHSPLTVKITKPDKIARLPKTGQAPITKTPRYADIDSPKTPKTGNAPIGYIAPKPKPRPKASSFTNMKSTVKKVNLPKPDDTPKPREMPGQQVAVQILKPETKKKSKPAPLDPIIDASTETPIPTGSPSNKAPIIPPVLKIKEEQKKVKPREITSQRSAITSVSKQSIIPKSQQKIVSNVIPKQSTKVSQSSRVSQTPRVVQAAPQKIVSKVKPKQAQRSPLSPTSVPKVKAKSSFRLRPVQAQSMPTPIPRRQRVVAAYVFPKKESKKTTKVEKEVKRKDFLGSSRTYHIEGMFKRTEIISGDKQSAKQLTRDKRYKEGKKKKVRKKAKNESFLQKMGVISPGLKI